jgi:hypothetical protein
MQIANVVGLGVLSSLPAAVAQWACLFLAPQPKMTRASSPNQRVIVARSILSKASQCALNVDQPVVRLRAGAGSMPFLLRMFATASNDISKSHHCTQAADGRTQQHRWSRLNRMVSWPARQTTTGTMRGSVPAPKSYRKSLGHYTDGRGSIPLVGSARNRTHCTRP